MSEFEEYVNSLRERTPEDAAAVTKILVGEPELSLRDRVLASEKPDPGVLRSRNWTREDWVAIGRMFGEDEADRRGETGEERENRARRAMGYWAWEWDGKPAGDGERYRLEFGYGTEGELAGVLRGGPDPKKGAS